MGERHQARTPPPHEDPFLEEVHRLKREAVEGLDMAQLAEKLRAIEEQHKDRLVPPPSKRDTSTA